MTNKTQYQRPTKNYSNFARSVYLAGAVGLASLGLASIVSGCGKIIEPKTEATNTIYQEPRFLNQFVPNQLKKASVTYQGRTVEGAPEGTYTLVFDSQTKEQRGSRGPEFEVYGNPSKLKMGTEYDVVYGKSSSGDCYFISATPSKK